MEDVRQDPDGTLVDRAKAAPEGDLRAFEDLVKRHQSKVLANCRYLSRSEADAEDLAQEVFIKAFFGLSRFEGRSVFRTWIQRIKVNHCLNYLKKREGKKLVDIEDPAHASEEALRVQPGAEQVVASAGERRIIESVLDSLADTLRVPLVMRDMDQMSYQEIAEALGVGLSAVKMRIKRGREEFQRRFQEMGGSAPAGMRGES